MNNSLEELVSKIKAGEDVANTKYKPPNTNVSKKIEPKEPKEPKELTSGYGNTFNALMQTAKKLDTQDSLRNQYSEATQNNKKPIEVGDIIGVIVAILIFGFFIVKGLYQVGVLR